MHDTNTIQRPKTKSRCCAESPQTRIPTDEMVARAVQERLSASCYFALRYVSCEFHEGMLMLRGKVHSFYMKQLAQETVRKIEGVGAIVNALEVGD